MHFAYWPSDPNSHGVCGSCVPDQRIEPTIATLIQHDAPHLRELTAFRDRLRSDALARQSYVDIKQSVAQQHRTDRDGYTAAKTNFVRMLLQQAGIEMQPRPEGGRSRQ